ncbi:MAG: hypothetical protein ACC660_06910 [Acidimicrobiales bacterium]
MAFVLNLVALVLVVGISWGGMMWLGTKLHARDKTDDEWVITEVRPGDPCPECDGVGAKRSLGHVEPCPLCEGRGTYTSIS